MQILRKAKKQLATLAALVLASSPMTVLANNKNDGIATINQNLIDTASSFGPLITMAAFMVGMFGMFKAVTTIMNYSDDPRENPLKNVVFYGVASALGFGYAFTQDILTQSIFKKEVTIGGEDIFTPKPDVPKG